MQNVSSKNNEHLIRASELFDGQCHQQFSEDIALIASPEVKAHLKNWALIRSALRNELPEQIDLNFSDKVMAQIEKEDALTSWVPPYEDSDDLPSMLKTSFNASQQDQSTVDDFDKAKLNEQETLVTLSKVKKDRTLSLKRVGIFVSQIAIAASVATVAVIGLQTYNAAEINIKSVASTASTTVGPVVGLNLASYQNSDSEIVLDVDGATHPENVAHQEDQANIKQKRQEEIDKINSYLNGYINEIASSN